MEVRDDCPSGVIYRPETERWSHYFEAHLPAQFDLLIHLDRTDALRPLDLWAGWDEGEPPETWPSRFDADAACRTAGFALDCAVAAER